MEVPYMGAPVDWSLPTQRGSDGDPYKEGTKKPVINGVMGSLYMAEHQWVTKRYNPYAYTSYKWR